MKKLFSISLTLILLSCTSDNEKEITALFEQVNNSRLAGRKSDAISYCESIISLDQSNIDAYRLWSELTFETGDFERSLELNKKLTSLDPDAYQYHAKTGLLLALFDKNEESETHYVKARALLSKKEREYWAKTDTLSMASMFMSVGDSTRSRELIKAVIQRKQEDSSYVKAILEFNDYSHEAMIKHLKKIMAESEKVKADH